MSLQLDPKTIIALIENDPDLVEAFQKKLRAGIEGIDTEELSQGLTFSLSEHLSSLDYFDWDEVDDAISEVVVKKVKEIGSRLIFKETKNK